MVAISLPPPPPPRRPRRILRSFHCTDELWAAFQERAKELGCSVDWLITDAMKRALERLSRPEPSAPAASLAPPAPANIALVCGQTRLVVDKARVVLGRSGKDAQLVLRDAGVSRQHAMIERIGNAFFVIDMASTNGVVVNGKKTLRAIIGPGDVLAIGPFMIRVERA